MGEVVIPAGDLAKTLAFFVDRLGFRLEAIFPAEAPAVAVISGRGLRLRLDDHLAQGPGTLRLFSSEDGEGAGVTDAPNGTRIEWVDPAATLEVPPSVPELVVSRLADASWSEGRAGMRYRDLIPGRQGGRFIASHIHVPRGGETPDYVHFHRVRFQMIFCRRGWVRVVYEDQGAPFRLGPGDCVLQPPEIRHRVLESSDDLEVVELGCPAAHETRVAHDLELPNARVETARLFSGQRFCRHEARHATWHSESGGVSWSDLGIAEATSGLAGVRVLRIEAGGTLAPWRHEGELSFWFALDGNGALRCDDRRVELAPGAAVTVPSGSVLAVEAHAALHLLEVVLPAAAGDRGRRFSSPGGGTPSS